MKWDSSRKCHSLHIQVIRNVPPLMNLDTYLISDSRTCSRSVGGVDAGMAPEGGGMAKGRALEEMCTAFNASIPDCFLTASYTDVAITGDALALTDVTEL
jgi:hypothetical protein